MKTLRRLWLRSHLPLIAALTVLAGASLIPFLWVLSSAFKSEAGIFGSVFMLPKEWHWSNFVTVWTDGNFATYFRSSLLVAVGVTTTTVLVSCPAGYAFAKLRLGRAASLFYVYLFAMTLPIQAVVIPVFYQLQSYGLLDSLLGLTLVLIATAVPLGVLLMRNFFWNLPDALIESAQIDGAGDWKVFLRVMLPLSRPAIMAVSVFSFLTAWNEYLLALLVLVSDDATTIPVGLVEFQGQYSSDYGALFAGTVLAIVPSVAVYLLLQRSFTRGIVSGALK